MIKASHWFGREWPVNFWNTDFTRHAAGDFAKLRSDGFNAVIVVVPWIGFAELKEGVLNEEMFQKLDRLILVAVSEGLRVILRVGYAHNSGVEHYSQYWPRLYGDNEIYRCYLAFMTEVGRRYGSSEALLMFFVCWEDYFFVPDYSNLNDEMRRSLANVIGFSEYVKSRMSLRDASNAFRASFAEWIEVPIPSRNEPAFELLLDFVKDAFINRYFKPVQALIPRLSAEVRIDQDPIFDGQIHLHSYDWSETWCLPEAEWVLTYFNPYFGAKNCGDAISADFVHDNLVYILSRFKEMVGGRRILIDQFNFRDGTPGLRLDYIADENLAAFLDLSAISLSKLVDGYGLWVYHGYVHNALSNPDLMGAVRGWRLFGEVEPLHPGICIRTGGGVAAELDIETVPGDRRAFIKITGRSKQGAALRVSIKSDTEEVFFAPLLSGTSFLKEVSVGPRASLTVEAEGSSVCLSSVQVYRYGQTSVIYNDDLSEGFLLPAIRNFNRQLGEISSADMPSRHRRSRQRILEVVPGVATKAGEGWLSNERSADKRRVIVGLSKADSLKAEVAKRAEPVDLDKTFGSLNEWLAWLNDNPYAGSRAAADAMAARIVGNGFTEPLTGIEVGAAIVDPGDNNWREALVALERNSRTRAVMYLIDEKLRLISRHEARIYAPEAITSLALCLRGLYPRFLGSEFAASEETRAQMYPIPHEDLMRLSLPSGAFDLVTTNEVLEHVPDLDSALGEIARVLKPDGWHVGTHPFWFMNSDGDVRTRLIGGEVVHLKPAEYHGNPFESGGSLVFETPGWNILDRARKAGFSEAHMRFIASEKHGFLTENTGVFVLCCRR